MSLYKWFTACWWLIPHFCVGFHRNRGIAWPQERDNLCACVAYGFPLFASRILKTWGICFDNELCQLKDGCRSPTSMGISLLSSHCNKLIMSPAWEETNLISIAKNWINKENGRHTLVFSILLFGKHIKKHGSNFNQGFSFPSKSNLKDLFVSV